MCDSSVERIYNPVHTGFPSPAREHQEPQLDLNSYVIRHHAATFFMRVVGDRMAEAHMPHDTIIAVDRSLKPRSGSIVVAEVDGDLLVRYLYMRRQRVYLEDTKGGRLRINNVSAHLVWGVVTHAILRICR